MGKKKSQSTGYAMAALAASLWGSLGILGTILGRYGLSPLQVATLRAGAAFVILGAVLVLAGRPLLRVTRGEMAFYAAYGLVSVAAFYVVYLVAIVRTGVGTAAMLLYTAPVYVVILAALLWGESLTRIKWTSLVLALAGCALVVGAPAPGRAAPLVLEPLGVLAGLAAGLTYALFTVFGRFSLARRSAWTTLFYALGWGSAFLLAACWHAGGLPPLPGRAWAWVLVLAAGPTLLAYFLYLQALLRVEASRASIICTVEPLVACLLALFILGETMGALQLTGGLLLLTGVTLAPLTPSRRGS
ncbi:MAG: EamA family transporter [Bacillota bacterium]|nr:EamA family transporter [Bacillota bacterium]